MILCLEGRWKWGDRRTGRIVIVGDHQDGSSAAGAGFAGVISRIRIREEAVPSTSSNREPCYQCV